MMKLSKKNKDRIFIFLMLLLPLTHFAVFWIYQNYSSILLAFQDEFTMEWTLDNFSRFFRQLAREWNMENGTLRYCIENTLITAGMRIFISMPLVVFASFVLFKKYFGHMFFRVVFYLPGIFGTVICATMTSYVLDATGPIVQWGSALGIKWDFEVLQSGLLGNYKSARLTYFISDLSIAGATVLLLTGALQKIPGDLFDVGRMEGTGIFNEFWHIALPCCWSTVGIMWLMTFAQVWGDFSRVQLLTGGTYNTNNFAYYLFANTLSATTGETSYNFPAAIGLILTAVIVPVTLFLRWLSGKIVPEVEF